MHAEIADDVLGIDQDVEQVRHRRALIAADLTHAGLQQRLGHREDALAAEGLALAERECLHLFLEGAFHRRYPTYPRRDARHPGTAGSSFPSPCASGESVPSGGYLTVIFASRMTRLYSSTCRRR